MTNLSYTSNLSYDRAIKATDSKLLSKEITPITIKGKRGKTDIVMSEDEEIRKVNFDKIASLPTVFDKTNGTITAANASKLSDGAACCLLMSEKQVKENNLEPMARVLGFEDSAVQPIDFPIAPEAAVKKLLKNTNITVENIARWEINEAFRYVRSFYDFNEILNSSSFFLISISCVVLANEKLLGLNLDLININGKRIQNENRIKKVLIN